MPGWTTESEYYKAVTGVEPYPELTLTRDKDIPELQEHLREREERLKKANKSKIDAAKAAGKREAREEFNRRERRIRAWQEYIRKKKRAETLTRVVVEPPSDPRYY